MPWSQCFKKFLKLFFVSRKFVSAFCIHFSFAFAIAVRYHGPGSWYPTHRIDLLWLLTSDTTDGKRFAKRSSKWQGWQKRTIGKIWQSGCAIQRDTSSYLHQRHSLHFLLVVIFERIYRTIKRVSGKNGMLHKVLEVHVVVTSFRRRYFTPRFSQFNPPWAFPLWTIFPAYSLLSDVHGIWSASYLWKSVHTGDC